MKMSGQELERLEDEEEDKETYYQFKRTQVAIGDLIDRKRVGCMYFVNLHDT
jgi:hypothetical protein